jgi:CRP-like cAMP-binding protein
VENVLPVLNKIAILGGLDDAQLYTVFRMLEVEHYGKGESIFRQGDSPSHIRIVRSGLVRIVKDIEATPMELFEFSTGDCFGETSVIAIHPHTASAVAMEDTDLLVIPRDKFFGLYDTDPKLFGMLALNIAREACRRLNKTEDIMLHYALTGKPGK